MIDSGPQRRVRAVQITPDAADTLNTLYDATWPENNAPEQLQALTRKLVEKTN